MIERINQLTEKLQPLIDEISRHSLYSHITSINHLRIFMEQHVFAVWDFMCLLKALHNRIVSTTVPWFPAQDALSANLISSILVEEEGDLLEDGINYASHYDMYIAAMKDIGANIHPIKKFLTMLQNGHSVENAIKLMPINAETKTFILTTFRFFDLETHQLAAAFVYGREGITHGMFLPLVAQLKSNQYNQQQVKSLTYYLQRHIELDNDEHYPKALRMLANLVNNDEQKLQEIEAAAIIALNARLKFLSAIEASFNHDVSNKLSYAS